MHSYQMQMHMQYSQSPLCVFYLWQKLFTETDAVLSPGTPNIDESVSGLLTTVEKSILFIGPQLKDNHTKMENNEIGNTFELMNLMISILGTNS